MNNPFKATTTAGGRTKGRAASRAPARAVQAPRAQAAGASGQRKRKTWTRKRKAVALSAIFGIIIGLGVTAAAGGTLYFTFQSQTDPFTASSAVELRNLNVVRDGDTLTVTGVLKNSGQTSISRLWIDNMAVSNLVAFQSLSAPGPDGTLDPTATNDNLLIFVHEADDTTDVMCLGVGTPISCPSITIGPNSIGGGTNDTEISITTRQFDGISMHDAGTNRPAIESVLEGGRTQAFKVVITCDGGTTCPVINISRDVAISDRLTLTFGYASGDDILVSDAYSARVRSG